ncbi:MAG: gamma-glutamylcyclotransferase [Bacteroidetes bacterium]|nr:MAG: gamma-glutamylcyclotransferase [Bacteroidota bacterium]
MNSPGVHKLFVYGSLRSGFKSHAYEYISRFFSFVGDAKVNGKLFDLGTYPAGVPSDDENYIIGELYTIKNEPEFAWAIGQLDDYEGVAVESDEVQLYQRGLVDVIINDTKTAAWIYWYMGSVEGKPLIQSGDMIEYLQQKNNPSATSAQ